MRTIYKYKLELKDEQEIVMPALANILCVQMQNGSPHIWAQLDSNASPQTRTIGIFGTGNPIPPYKNMYYIGTFQIHGAGLVFHVFELIKH